MHSNPGEVSAPQGQTDGMCINLSACIFCLMLHAEFLELLDRLPWSNALPSSQQMDSELELLNSPHEPMEVDNAGAEHGKPAGVEQGMFQFIAYGKLF